VDARPMVRENTDVFVTADHGFSTISRREIDAQDHFTKSYSAAFTYRDLTGRQEVNAGFLPGGHISIDLAHALNLPLYDPGGQIAGADGASRYIPVDPTIAQQTPTRRQRPLGGGVLGGSGRVTVPDAKVVIAGNSIYVPDRDGAMVRRVVSILANQDYVGGLFVHDSFGRVPGALPMSAIGMIGSTALPQPAVIVVPRGFSLRSTDRLATSVIVLGAGQEGQGGHGAFTRANTFNNMAAIGPDFKKRFIDRAPVSNADVPVTLASLIGVHVAHKGSLRGRVLSEALIQDSRNIRARRQTMRSEKSESGKATILVYQQIGQQRYLDEACFEVAVC